MADSFEKLRDSHVRKLHERKQQHLEETQPDPNERVWKVADMPDGTYGIQAPVGYFISGFYLKDKQNAKIVCDIVNLEAQDRKSVFYLG